MRKGNWLALVLIWVSSLAWASGGPGAVRKQIEASLLVTGSIDIATDGRVGGYQLDQAERLPPAVTELLGSRVKQWRFEPVLVDGKPVRARTRMQLRLIAKPTGEDQYLVRVAGANFGEARDGESPTSRGDKKAPRYPEVAARAGVGGTTYLVLRIGRDGRVEDVVAEQVNLRVVANERDMQRLRDLLAQSAVTAARAWEFNPPVRGAEVDARFWSVRVPVDFVAPDQRVPNQAGEWTAYVPGPRRPVPWRDWDDAKLSPDAVAAGGVYPDRPTGPQLLTPLDKS